MSMRIAFIAPFGIRPKGTVLARMVPLAAALQGLGHQVTIVAPPYTNPEDAGTVEVVQGVTLRNIRLGPGGKAFSAPFLAGRLLRAALEGKPDLVHLFKPKGYGGLSAMVHLGLASLGKRLPPLVVDTDDREGRGGMETLHRYSRGERLLFRFQEKWLPLHAAGVTVASRALQTLAWGEGVAPERVFYLPNCVDDLPPASGTAARECLGIGPQERVLLLYTRFFEFSQEKLHHLFAELFHRVPGVRFLVVGQGRNNEEEQLQEAARREGFAGALAMVGWARPDELPGLLAAGDVAIYPFGDTLVNRAKCPAKLTEIIRAGVPVVADRVGQIPEYLDHGEGGWLCDPDDWPAMVERTAELLRAPEASRRMGEAGRGHLLRKFAWKRYAARLERFYGQLLGT